MAEKFVTWKRRIFRICAIIPPAAGMALLLLACWPPAPLELTPRPVLNFDAAKAMTAPVLEDEKLSPECEPVLLDHGRRTQDVYVLLHGLTNCPAQFHRLGEILHARGANVLIPRMPYHGFADVMTDQQRFLTAQGLLDWAGQAVDQAQGLGDRVTVVGLSINAVTVAWLAQKRSDIHRAVLLAPFFAPKGIPSPMIAPMGNLLCRLPNVFLWWDPKTKNNRQGALYSYPRFATRPIGQVMRLGVDAFRRARLGPPRAQKILVITSAADQAVSNARTREFVAVWQKSAPEKIRTHEFPADWDVPHDFIDPTQPNQQVERVYPVLLEQLEMEE